MEQEEYGRSGAEAPSGCQPTASAASASSQSGIPNAACRDAQRLHGVHSFRKRPVVVEAVRVNASDWNGATFDGCPFDYVTPWLQEAVASGTVRPDCPGSTDYAVWRISTLEGEMIAEPDDWIIRGVKGELYPCKPDIFEATYEPASGIEAGTDETAQQAQPEGREPGAGTADAQ